MCKFFCANELKQIEGQKADILELVDTIKSLNNQLNIVTVQLPKINPKENELNTKYPTTLINYSGRWLKEFGQMSMDVRGFFQNELIDEITILVKDWINLADDIKAIYCQTWIKNNITYVSDKTDFGLDEFWSLPQETLFIRKGDCEDGAILMANLMVASGIPYWKIRLSAAEVFDQNGKTLGGHCFVTYFVESLNYWVAMDWCFYPDTTPVAQRPDYKQSILYGKGTVWFSWNKKYAFSKIGAEKINVNKDFFPKSVKKKKTTKK